MPSPRISDLRAAGWTDDTKQFEESAREGMWLLETHNPRKRLSFFRANMGLYFGARRWHGRWWVQEFVAQTYYLVQHWYVDQPELLANRGSAEFPPRAVPLIRTDDPRWAACMATSRGVDYLNALRTAHQMGGFEAVAAMLRPPPENVATSANV